MMYCLLVFPASCSVRTHWFGLIVLIVHAGNHFFDVACILTSKHLRAFLLENVKNLLSHNSGHTFSIIRDTLEKSLVAIL